MTMTTITITTCVTSIPSVDDGDDDCGDHQHHPTTITMAATTITPGDREGGGSNHHLHCNAEYLDFGIPYFQVSTFSGPGVVSPEWD